MTALTCPKCQAEMRQYERSGITVDQCSACQGLFLDRGELERLMEAEAAYYGRQPTPPPPPPPGGGYQPGYAQPGYPPPGGFLGGLFGGGGHGGQRRGHH